MPATTNNDSQDSSVHANLMGHAASMTKGWAKNWLVPGYDSSIDVTLGHATSILGGFPWGTSSDIVTGGSMSLTIDPLGWLPDNKLSSLLQVLMPTGECSGLFGNARSLHYGDATSIHHGGEVERREKQVFNAANPRTYFVGGIVVSTTALTLLGWLLQNKKPVVWEKLVRGLGARGVSGTLLSLLIEFEKAGGELDAGIDMQIEAASLAEQIGFLGLDYKELLGDLAVEANLLGVALGAQSAASAAGGAAEAAAEEAEEEAGEDANINQCYDGVLTTRARHISMCARASEELDMGPSMVHINAEGAEGEDNGVVAIRSTGQATMSAGPAAVQVRRKTVEGQVDITSGPVGKVTIESGLLGSKAVLEPESIELSIGLPEAGPLIQMTPEGIKIAFGPPGGACIELNAMGVTMSCGANSVAVQPEGQATQAVNITQEAVGVFEAKGASATLEGEAMTTVKGGITMIN